MCISYLAVDCEWDPKKAIENYRKHGVRFADATAVLMDQNAITIHQDREEEDRYATIGFDSAGRLLLVVYAARRQRLRIISVRRANRSEAANYRRGR